MRTPYRRRTARLDHGVLLLALAATPLASCRSQAEREAAAEIQRIAGLVDQLRQAPNNAKEAPLERLRAERCLGPSACELQQLCVQGYTLHLKAIDTATRVRAAVRGGTANAEAATDVLTLSERDLERGKALIDRCVSVEGELLRESLP